MRSTPLLALLAVACQPFSHWPDNSTLYIEDQLWDPDVVAAVDGVYVRLPRAGDLVRVNDDGSYDVVDLDGAQPQQIIATPDASSVLVFARWPSCRDEDPKITHVSDCADEDLVWNSELEIVADARRTSSFAIPAQMNALEFSDDGSTAVAYYDEQKGDIPDIEGIVDLTEVVFIPLDGGDMQAVSIGFSPNHILFTPDNTRAVVMSRSSVTLVDLETFEWAVTYPLTDDPDKKVDAADAAITADGHYALIAIKGSSDLFEIDLVNPSIDLKELDAPPSDLAVYTDPQSGTGEDPGLTLIAYSSLSQVDVLDMGTGELQEPIDLEVPTTSILTGDGFAVLYNTTTDSVHDVYRVDLETTELTVYVVDNPVDEMRLNEGGNFAVGILRPENASGSSLDQYQDQRWGLAVVDLTSNDSVSLVVESQPVGLELIEDDQTTFALILMQDVDTLLQVDLAHPSVAEPIELPAGPTGIGTLPDGRFYITHDDGLGLISFLDPSNGKLDSTAGFAAVDLFPDDTLPRRDAKE